MRLQKSEINKPDTISLKLPHNFIVQIDNLAKKENKSRNSIIKKFLAKSLKNNQIKTESLNKKNELSFISYSAEIFATEWESDDDEKAFINLQKYAKK